MKIMESRLWRKAEEKASAAGKLNEWRVIQRETEALWNRATEISKRISNELPQLTLHDEDHLEAVLHTSEMILGPDLEITPMETFVLTTSVALHDLAHSTTVYEGGIDAVKQTPNWRDAVLELSNLATDQPDPDDNDIINPPAEIHDMALFYTLRALHASQAAELLNFKIPLSGGKEFLLGDTELREHYGTMIGMVAASHHWSHGKLGVEFSHPLGERATYQGFGSVDPLRVACLLRTSDAAQIDQRRAHDAAKKIHKPVGVSLHHWQAQNMLAVPTESQYQYPNGLIFTSTKPFGLSEIPSWWTAYNLIETADRELRLCDDLLTDRALPQFDKRYVVGSSSPGELANYVRTSGWDPLGDRVRISQPDHIINTLAGAALYGQNYWVPIRELLQNSVDAVHSRRQIDSTYQGEVSIYVHQGKWNPYTGQSDPASDGVTIQVCDNGIGMSASNLQNYLLDFGASLKRENSIKNEFPALRGKRIRNIGKYGIGFFSVKMISKSVWVRSRQYNSGYGDSCFLCFQDGELAAPFTFPGREPQEYESYSTVVSVYLDKERVKEIQTVKSETGNFNFEISRLFGFLAPCVDVDIYVKIDGNERKRVHSRDWDKASFEDWLADHSLIDSKPINSGFGYLEPRNLLMGVENVSEGWAGLSSRTQAEGFYVEGGLRCLSNNPFVSHNFPFVGAMPAISTLASRQADRSNIGSNARNQFCDSYLAAPENNLEPLQMLAAALNLSIMGGDISQYPIFQINGKRVTPLEIVDKLGGGTQLSFPVELISGRRIAYVGLDERVKATAWDENVVSLYGIEDIHKMFRGHFFGELSWTESTSLGSTSIFSQIFRILENDEIDIRIRLQEPRKLGNYQSKQFQEWAEIRADSYSVERVRLAQEFDQVLN